MVPNDHRARIIFGFGYEVRLETNVFDLVLIHEVLEFAVAVGITEKAVVIAVGQQQFEDGLADSHHALRVRVDDHSVHGGRGAGRRHPAHVVDLDDAESATSVGRHLGVMAQSGII